MSSIKLLKFTRYSEWWEYKMVPLLAVAYLIILTLNQPFKAALPRIALLFAALIVGAIYVSVINDITDIREDALAGKRNSMANLSPAVRVFIVLICLTLGTVFILLLYPDFPSMIFQALSYLVFTLYSVRPIRLKKRGFWGVLCDASGAHLFPSLLVASNLVFYFGGHKNLLLILAIAVWSFMYGLRGILWHQFFDRENDIKSGTKTFAIEVEPNDFKIKEKIIFTIEVIALAMMLSTVFNVYVMLGLLCYMLLLLARRYVLGYKISFIISPKNQGYQLMMNDYYFVFLPLSLLLTNALAFYFGWFILFIHMVIFPSKIISVGRDVVILLKTTINKTLN
ncbi:4-hydroxybenzoate polyprenyltransferase [Pedobacter sp. UYEF25]